MNDECYDADKYDRVLFNAVNVGSGVQVADGGNDV